MKWLRQRKAAHGHRQVFFDIWINNLRRKNGGMTLDKFCKKLGICRSTLWKWRINPEVMKPIELAGIMKLMDDQRDFEELCDKFGIDLDDC